MGLTLKSCASLIFQNKRLCSYLPRETCPGVTLKSKIFLNVYLGAKYKLIPIENVNFFDGLILAQKMYDVSDMAAVLLVTHS